MTDEAARELWVQWALPQCGGSAEAAGAAADAAMAALGRGATAEAAADAARAVMMTQPSLLAGGLAVGEAASPSYAAANVASSPITAATLGKWSVGLIAMFMLTTCLSPFALVGAAVMATLAILNPSRLGATMKGWRIWSWVPGLGGRKSAIAFAAVLLLYAAPWSGLMTALWVSAITNPSPRTAVAPPAPETSPTPPPRVETQAQAPLRAIYSAQAPTTVTAGQTVDLVLKVENRGRYISDFGFSFASGDNWLDHNAVSSSGPCSRDQSIKGFRCGPIDVGRTLSVDIAAVAYDAGHFQYLPDPNEYWDLRHPQAINIDSSSGSLAFNQTVDQAVAVLSPTSAPSESAPAPPATQNNPAPPSNPKPTQKPAPPPPAQPPSSSCHASMSNDTPGRGGSDTLNVASNVPNTTITMTAHYKTTNSTYTGTTDGGGSGSITFGIGHPTAGYRVVVDVTVGSAHCQTSFTPQ
jgi:hypothetical protein